MGASEEPQKSDMHHLFPCKDNINSSRGNNPYGENSDQLTDYWFYLDNTLEKYDWLHLHHEDFTGQYGKFYKNYHNANWYKNMQSQFENTEHKHGFNTVHELKKNVALKCVSTFLKTNFDGGRHSRRVKKI